MQKRTHTIYALGTMIALFGITQPAKAGFLQIPNFVHPQTKNLHPDEPMVPYNETLSLSGASRAWQHNPITIDCGCQYSTKMGNKGQILQQTCGYANRSGVKAPLSAQWSRVIPLEHLALGRDCASGAPPCHDSDGHALFGAACCAIIDPQFKRMTNDVWNWAPMVSGIVQDRGESMFGILPSGVSPYGNCPIKIDPQRGTLEPVDKEKGVIARVYLYFANQWNVPFTPSELDTYKLWNEEYPATQDEKERASIINDLQRKTNPYYPNTSFMIENNTQ